jgi:hypothetical protein
MHSTGESKQESPRHISIRSSGTSRIPTASDMQDGYLDVCILSFAEVASG